MLSQILFILLAVSHCAFASSGFDFGDALALIIGLVIGIVGICACLGCYAKRRADMDAL